MQTSSTHGSSTSIRREGALEGGSTQDAAAGPDKTVVAEVRAAALRRAAKGVGLSAESPQLHCSSGLCCSCLATWIFAPFIVGNEASQIGHTKGLQPPCSRL